RTQDGRTVALRGDDGGIHAAHGEARPNSLRWDEAIPPTATAGGLLLVPNRGGSLTALHLQDPDRLRLDADCPAGSAVGEAGGAVLVAGVRLKKATRTGRGG
ncbi:MAG: hypothetical protein AB1758_36430, partial [Candidatus Eremiobacterota bacterium]